MLRREAGFTLIELMIVIAIIGILAAIAIPNFISYRNKSFCSAAESDANNIASGLADYFAVPTRTGLPTHTGATQIVLGSKSYRLSGANTGSIAGTSPDAITITVTDVSSRCPTEYKNANTNIWTNAASNTVTKTM